MYRYVLYVSVYGTNLCPVTSHRDVTGQVYVPSRRTIQRLYKEQQSSLLHQCPRWHTQACLAPMCLKNGSGNALAGRLWEFFLGRILKTLPHPKCTAHLVCPRDSSCEWVDFVSARMLAYLSRNVRPSRYQNGTHQTPSRIHSTTDVPVLLARKGVWHIHS